MSVVSKTVGALVAGVLCVSSVRAQTASKIDSVAVRDYIERHLSDSSFRRRPCVVRRGGDCPGGVMIVRSYQLSAMQNSADTSRYQVIFDIVGIVGVSEAAPFFMPRSQLDTVVIAHVRPRSRWIVSSLDGDSDASVRTRPEVARHYFDLDAEDHRLLDSSLAVPRRR